MVHRGVYNQAAQYDSFLDPKFTQRAPSADGLLERPLQQRLLFDAPPCRTVADRLLSIEKI